VRTEISLRTKDKSCLDLSFQYGAKRINVSLSILFISEFEERGIRRKNATENVLDLDWEKCKKELSGFLVEALVKGLPYIKQMLKGSEARHSESHSLKLMTTRERT
jgi:hypothetical protein